MTEIASKEFPLCCVCGVATEADIVDPALGELCYDCRNAVAQAEIALLANGLTTPISTPKNNKKTHS